MRNLEAVIFLVGKMWNPKSGPNATRKDVSVAKGEKNLLKKQTDTLGEKGEVELQSGGVDSGFLSGPQLSFEGEAGDFEQKPDNKIDDTHGQTAASYAKEAEREYVDSGLLEDIEEDKEPKKENTHMLLDRGVDSGLTEWFCNLSLKNSSQPLNNLGSEKSAGKKSAEQNISGKTQPQKAKSTNPWEVYYQQNDDGDTQLHLACITGYVEVVLALIRLAPHPCLLDIQNDEAQGALHLAVLTGQAKLVRVLLVAGAEATIRDRNGNTPLHLACTSGDLECFKALTVPISAAEIQEAKRLNFTKWEDSSYVRCAQLPPDLEQRNYDGERCVHLAAQGSHIEILRHLMWLGADINAREGKSGRTPLHIAIETFNEVLANFLLEECQKVNLEAATYAGLTAYQLAVIAQNQQMQVHLERRGVELLTPPESDDDSDFDYDDPQMYDRFGDPGYFVSAHGGSNPINVM